MNETVADTFKLGIGVALASIIIWGVLILLTNLQSVNATLAEQQRFNREYDEYREFCAYDDTEVRAQDIVTAVMTYKGTVAVYVYNNGVMSPDYMWNTSNQSTAYSTTSILSVLDQNKMYQASLQKGYNGEVQGIHFRRK